MPMSPRLLRPIASGLSIGQLRRDLALYLPVNETASSGDIAAGDHSGNGFTFTSVNSVLSTAGKVGNAREFIKANQTHLLGSSTSSLLQFGGGDWSLQFWLNLTGPLPTTATNATVMARNVNIAGAYAAGEFSVAIFFNSCVTNIIVSGANNLIFTQFGELLADTWHHIVFTNTGTTVSYYRDGNLIGTGTRTGTWLTGARHTVIGIPNTNAMAAQAIDAKIDEFAKWNRTLSANDVKALYNNGNGRSLGSTDVYQQVSNADAEDWVNRVYANGGTVSTSTASAVNTFCDAIDAAGIRDRFYRLSLVCGDNLNAALVPLYLAESQLASVRGSTTDSNFGYISGDYSPTTGLTRTVGTKYLNTGLAASVMPQADRHMSSFFDSSVAVGSTSLMGFDNFPSPGNAFWTLFNSGSTQASFRASAASTSAINTVSSGRNHFLVSGNGTAESYINGVAAATMSLTEYTSPSLNIYIGATNRGVAAVDINNHQIMGYSIGLAFTSSQAAAFNTVINELQSALGR